MLPAHQISSFSFQKFDKDSNFESLIALYGYANVVRNESVLQLTYSVSSSPRRVMYKKPIKLAEGNPVNLASFTTYLSFSMSPDVGDGLAFVMVSGGFNVSAFASSPFGLSLRSGKSDSEIVTFEFEKFSKLWSDENIYIYLSSSNGKSSQMSFIYSWSFELRGFTHGTHSEPLDLQTFGKNAKTVVIHKRSACVLRVLGAMIFGTACGALGAFMVLYLWSIFSNRRPVVPEECCVHPVDYEYKKVKVAVEKAIEDGKQ